MLLSSSSSPSRFHHFHLFASLCFGNVHTHVTRRRHTEKFKRVFVRLNSVDDGEESHKVFKRCNIKKICEVKDSFELYTRNRRRKRMMCVCGVSHYPVRVCRSSGRTPRHPPHLSSFIHLPVGNLFTFSVFVFIFLLLSFFLSSSLAFFYNCIYVRIMKP